MRNYPFLKKFISLGLVLALLASTSLNAVAANDMEGNLPAQADVIVDNADSSNQNEEETIPTVNPVSDPVVVVNDVSSDDSNNEEINKESEEPKAETTPEETPEEITEETPCQHIDADEDGKCDLCGQDMVEEPEPEAVVEETTYSYRYSSDDKHIKINDQTGEEIEEACQYNENGICKFCGHEQEKDIIFNDSNVEITVTGTKAALNGAVAVRGQAITDGDQYEEIQASLSEKASDEGKDLLAFVAYDITLVDALGAEVEPNGAVKVNFVTLQAPDTEENLEDASVAITHFEEVEGTEETNLVDLTEETKFEDNGDNATVDATFETSSFSAYTASWTSPAKTNDNKVGTFTWEYSSWWTDEDHLANLYLVDENGKAINVNDNHFTRVSKDFNNEDNLDKAYSATDNDYFAGVANVILGNTSVYEYDGTYIQSNNSYIRINNLSYNHGNWEANDWHYVDGNSNGWVGWKDHYNNSSNNNVDVYIQLKKTIEQPELDERYTYFPVDLFDYQYYGSDHEKSNPLNYAAVVDAQNKNVSKYVINSSNGWGDGEPWNQSLKHYDDGRQTYDYTDGKVYQNIPDQTLDSNGMISFSQYGTPGFFSTNGSRVKPTFDNFESDYEYDEGNPDITIDRKAINYKDGYYNVSFPFIKDDDGYYEYNSEVYDATLNKNTGIVELNAHDPNVDRRVKEFYPFNDAADLGSRNLHFGMHMTTPFKMTADGKVDGEDCVFEFSGDDDLWVYVDGKLILDMGGSHPKVWGSINFATGVVTISSVYVEGQSGAAIPSEALTYNMYSDWNSGLAANGSITSPVELRSIRDNKEHTMQIYYMERGDGDSNCKIRFNLPDAKLAVVDFDKVDEEGELLDGATFTLTKEGEETGVTATSSEGHVGFANMMPGTYILKETEAPEGFKLPEEGTTWKVTVMEDGTYTIEDIEELPEGKSYLRTKQVQEEGQTFNRYEIVNLPLDTLEVNKSAKVKNFDERTYEINLQANASITDVKPVVKNADVVLAMDASGSMIFTDAPIISGTTGSDAYSKLETLDTSKIYFSNPFESPGGYYPYGDGKELQNQVRERLLPGATSGNRTYALPTSGFYLFYKDGSWYKKGVSNLTSNNPFSTGTSHTTKLTDKTADQCPKTIYTNRSEIAIRAAKQFLANLGPGANVSIVKYGANGGAQVVSGFKPASEYANDNLLGIAGVYYTATYTGQGLGKAFEQLNNLKTEDYNNNQFAILFTDGNAEDNNTAINNAGKIKNLPAELFVIGTNEAAAGNLKSYASSDSHCYAMNSLGELGSAFTSIANKIGVKAAEGCIVTDVVDSRFDLTDANGNLLADGATFEGGKVTKDANGNYTIVWEGQTIGKSETEGQYDWNKTIYVKAKPDFMGGNVIPTNGAASGVVAGELSELFPRPTVNVKLLDIADVSAETTVLYKDQLVSGRAQIEDLLAKVVESNSVLSENDINFDKFFATDDFGKVSLKAGEKVDYSYPGTDDKVGEFTMTMSELSGTTADQVGDNKYTYSVTLTYTALTDRSLPEPVKEGRANPSTVGTQVSSEDGVATYNINVVDIMLAAQKNGRTYDSEDETVLKNAELEYTLFTDEACTIAAKSPAGSDLKATSTDANGLMTFNGLGIGTYYLKETKAPTGYSLSNEVTKIVVAKAEGTGAYKVTVGQNDYVFNVFADGENSTIDSTKGYLFDGEGKAISENTTTTKIGNESIQVKALAAANMIKVVDYEIYRLPETGGSGVYVYTVGGILLMIAAALLLYKNKNKKNK